MAKPKLILAASPTFKTQVAIPVAGGASVNVEFTFKHRPKDEFLAWIKADLTEVNDDVDLVKDVASGWNLDDEFSDDNIKAMTQTYGGSARAIVEKYIREQSGAKLGN